MYAPLVIVVALLAYMGVLLAIALWAERRAQRGRSPADNGLVYSLSLAVYCSAWTYYGSVGNAVSGGLQFAAVFIGPTLVLFFAGTLLRKMVRLKRAFHFTSIADFIAARYRHSRPIGLLVTLIVLIGVVPYIALQLRVLIGTFLIVVDAEPRPGSSLEGAVGLLVVLLTIGFTILFGARRLNPAERHPGMVVALAAECVVKLAAFLAAGLFVTYALEDGFGPLLDRMAALRENAVGVFPAPHGTAVFEWSSYVLLSAFAFLLLPRQFHVGVIENVRERHLRTAMWAVPLYLLLFNLFVPVIAVAGLEAGLAPEDADTFVLQLPALAGHRLLALFVYLGGFSAAIGMVMISAMTTSTMVVNHAVVPVAERWRALAAVRGHLLPLRWLVIALIVLVAYSVERALARSFLLANIGIIAFAVILQLVPLVLGALYWRGASRAGAAAGLVGGTAAWGYTLALPAMVRSGWLPGTLLTEGPFGLALLRPEQLGGLSALGPVPHALLWSLLANVGLFVAVSILKPPDRLEQRIAETFAGPLDQRVAWRTRPATRASIELTPKQALLEQLFATYFGERQGAGLAARVVADAGLVDRARISIDELGALHEAADRVLSGALGAASAQHALGRAQLIDEDEERELSALYAEALADLRLPPAELKRRIDFHREREELLRQHARELEEKVEELRRAMEARQQAEEAVRRLNEQLERQVAEREAALRVANKELEVYAFGVSSELAAPLARLEELSVELMEAPGDRVDPETRALAGRMRANVRRLQQLVDDHLGSTGRRRP